MRELRWNCDDKGCFRQLCPKLGVFDDCFPGKIGMSDVDGIVEIAGRILLLEWKSDGGSLGMGQRIMFEQMTALSRKITVIVVHGDPAEMTIKTVQVFSAGQFSQPEPSTLAELKERISAWAEKANLARVRPSKRSVS
jgi:hypothetical protein